MRIIDKLKLVQERLINLNGKTAYLQCVERQEKDGGFQEVVGEEIEIRGRLALLGRNIPEKLRGVIGEKDTVLYVFSVMPDVDVELAPRRKYILKIGDRAFEVVGKEDYKYENEVWGRSLFVSEVL